MISTINKIPLEDRWMSTRDVAAYLSLSPKWGHHTVGRWVREGRLVADGKVGKEDRFLKSRVDEFVTSNKAGEQ